MTRTPLRWPTMSRATRRRAIAGTVIGVTLAGLLTAAVATSGAATAATAANAVTGTPSPSTATQTITLITGDVVHVTNAGGGKQAAQIERPPTATGGVRVETVDKDLYVIPDEVVPYLASKRLDRRLFNVTDLLADGYGDRSSTGIPLIVSYDKATPTSAPAVPDGTTRVRNLPSVNGVAVRAPKNHARDVWRGITQRVKSTPRVASFALTPGFDDGVSKIWLDGRVHADLADSVPLIGAPAAWAAGHDGSGVKVAVLDTGADLTHPDLVGQVISTQSFVPGVATVADGHGHGTHVASTIAGTGEASGGQEKGVAPGADLMIGKVLSDEGYGEDSWVIAGMEWAAHNGADIISMSLGGDEPSDGTDPTSAAVNQLTEETGTLFVIAAGNSGAEGWLTGPGAANDALTVAATDSSDTLAFFSTLGPRSGDYAMKPDIAAPGVDILAAKAGGNATDGYYQSMSGTSMATPHVAGAAAIVVQQHPDWTYTQIKDALMSTSKQLDYTAYQVGAGRVDVAAVDAATITATGSVYFGLQPYPQSAAAPLDRTVTYTNTGNSDVTLHLAETATIAGGPIDFDPEADKGTPAPDGIFGLSSDTVTVPAHGTATVTSTARPSLATAGRRYLGQILATDDGGTLRARTQIGFYAEDERHAMHISLRDRAGNPVSDYVYIQMLGVSPDPVPVLVGATGELDLKLRAGTYSVYSLIEVTGSHGPDSRGTALLGDPEVILDRDRVVSLDGRQAVEATAVVPRHAVDRMLVLDWYRADDQGQQLGLQYILPDVHDSMFAQPTRAVTQGAFEYESRWRKEQPLLTLTQDGRDVPSLVQAGSKYFDGKAKLDVVYVGTGSPDEYAGKDLRGKIALAVRSDALTGMDRTRAAEAAGAALLLVVNDGPGKLMQFVGTEDMHYSTVPVATLTERVGNPLIAAALMGRLSLSVVGVPSSSFAYDLVDPRPGRIPSDLTYRPRQQDFAVVNMVFHGSKTYDSGEVRLDFRDDRPFSAGYLMRMYAPSTRTDYLSTPKGTSWMEAASSGPDAKLESLGLRRTYRAGTRTTVDWFGAVIRPRDSNRFYPSVRVDGAAQINIQPWSDGGAGHAGYLVREDGALLDTLSLKVYENGALVKTSDWAQTWVDEVPNETTTFTIDLEASRDPSVWRLSPRTHTTWQVISKPVANPEVSELMPLLQLDYGVDTDLSGDARGGRQRLTLTASHLAGAVGAGRVTGASLSVSFDDGKTWHRVDLTKSGAGWATTFNAPSRGFVSLRATAWDSVGNRITQEVVRAYGLGT